MIDGLFSFFWCSFSVCSPVCLHQDYCKEGERMETNLASFQPSFGFADAAPNLATSALAAWCKVYMSCNPRACPTLWPASSKPAFMTLFTPPARLDALRSSLSASLSSDRPLPHVSLPYRSQKTQKSERKKKQKDKSKTTG